MSTPWYYFLLIIFIFYPCWHNVFFEHIGILCFFLSLSSLIFTKISQSIRLQNFFSCTLISTKHCEFLDLANIVANISRYRICINDCTKCLFCEACNNKNLIPFLFNCTCFILYYDI